MIPIRLQLKNFMSYGEHVPVLDFAGIRCACLSGDNGNGKSALLDAMTWALFGRTRAKSEDDVIRRGTTDCQVVFDFEVQQTRYRVDRRRTKRGASWELQAEQEDGSFRPLTGSGARETEGKIRNILRMDYDMFLASGYVAQGRADEFTRITPAKRKEILADILNIGFYEQLEKMAKEKHDEARDRETEIEREINGINAQVALKPSFEQRLQEAESQRDAFALQAESLRAQYEERKGAIQILQERKKRADHIQEQITDLNRNNKNDNDQLIDVEDRIGRAENIRVRREEILNTYARFISLTEEIALLDEQCQEFRNLQRQAGDLDKLIRDAERELDRERYNIQEKINQLEQEAEFITQLTAEITQFDVDIAQYGDLELRFQEAEGKRSEAERNFTQLREEHASVKAEQVQLQTRLEALISSTAAVCEYCGQALPSERRHQAMEETRTLLERIDHLFRDLKIRGSEAKRLVDLAQREQQIVQSDQLMVTRLSTQRAQATQEHLRLTERAKEMPGLQRRHDALERRLKERDYAPEAFDALTRVTAQLERLERVEQKLKDARKMRIDCGDIERQRLALESAEQDLIQYPPQRDELRKRIEVRNERIENAKQKVIAILNEVASLRQLEAECEELSAELQRADMTVRGIDREIVTCQTELARLADFEKQRLLREEERKAAAHDRDTYKELIAAFGKKGIQQLIIERALPEIEEQANEILGRMTNNAMRVELRSTREGKSKSAGTMETLDIIISDDLGERPYEMYSGGEAFRVNFALRIALSKVLAQRAGAPLQTLILDEGFGTQDPRGREAIVEALQSVQDQFALILVITHIEELKDAFPTRIEVVKGPDGSTFTVQ